MLKTFDEIYKDIVLDIIYNGKTKKEMLELNMQMVHQLILDIFMVLIL